MTDPSTSPEPIPERLISDVETLKALSDPLRLRILEIMVAAADETFTVKRLATTMGTSPTKLYHHVNLLLDRQLINVAGQRVVSGIIETSYRVAQRSVRLDRALLAAEAPAMHDTLTTIFEGARDDIEQGLRAGTISAAADAPTEAKLLLARGLAALDPAQAAAFRERLIALLDEFGEGDGPRGPERPAYGLLLGFYPMPDAAEDDR